MSTKLSELFALERMGLHKEALESLPRARALMGDSPVAKLNLDLLEQRLRVKPSFRARPDSSQEGCVEKPAFGKARHRSLEHTWSAIITMWKRVDYLAEQLAAIRKQSIAPLEIIIILNENHISESKVRAIAGPDARVIRSDINSLYARWALAYVAQGNYVSVFDDDAIPGELWIANAMRACDRYHALVGPSGRIHNSNGHQGYFKSVVPQCDPADDKLIDCGETDVYCDWVCNAYFFKREWVGYALGDVRYLDSSKTFDDIQLATSLWLHGGIRCVTPMQPAHDTRLHGHLKPKYGNDAHAVWKTNQDQHFSARKSYIESLVVQGYVPAQQRENLFRLHLIVPFGERSYLERCLLSVKGQDYRNFTCTLVDDCHDGGDSLDLLRRLQLDGTRFRYIKTSKKAYPLRAREMATDMLQANPADVVIHLDGDDWLPYPDVLSRLNRIYRNGGVLATYGNALCVRDLENRDFRGYTDYAMSRRWNAAQKEPQATVFPFRRIEAVETANGWGDAPWCGLHLRSFQYAKWLGLSRKTFRDDQGRYLRVATDAAILVPLLDACRYDTVTFVPDLSYVYQNAGNTIHAKNEVTVQEKNKALAVIANARNAPDLERVRKALLGERTQAIPADAVMLHDGFDAEPGMGADDGREQAAGATSIVTIITPDYLPDAMLCLVSYQRNLRLPCHAHVFIATEDKAEMEACAKLLEGSGLNVLFPADLHFTSARSRALAGKYKIKSDEYRWAMKSVVLLELLQRGAPLALFLDPDVYTVSDITDVHQRMIRSPVSVFPHFRDPDHEYLRSVLYKDGFFNGGVLAATPEGTPHLTRLYNRCLHEMVKNPARSRWDDQKYFDLFAIEVQGLYVNHDRGIDYNYWNYEPIEDIVGPSQRSCLLKSGYFVRHWHISTVLVKNSIELTEPKFAVYRPVVAMYLLSLLYAISLLVAAARWKGAGLEQDEIGLLNRYRGIEDKLKKLSGSIPVHEPARLHAVARQVEPGATAQFLSEWAASLSQSILFDNLELFARAMNALFRGAPGVDDAVSAIRKKDLRHLADDVVASPMMSGKHKGDAQKESAGELVKRQLRALQACGINY
jgi:glycosyltransferase involved in cell wall biosynthesis